MGTWAVQATATRAMVTSAISVRGIPARLRELVGVMVAQMLGDDDDGPTMAVAAPDDSYPYYLSKDRLALDPDHADSEPEATEPELVQTDDPAPAEPQAAEPQTTESASDPTPSDPESDPAKSDPESDPAKSDPAKSDPAPSGTQKQRHTPRHAAPSPTLAAKLSSAKPKLPGFAPKSSHAGW